MAQGDAAEHQDLFPRDARPIPTLEVLDIAAIAKIAHDAGATLVVDNVFSTPLWQSPLELGADCVVYSATKHIDGQGRCLGGVDPRLGKIHQRQRPPASSARPAPRCRRSMPGCMLKGLETLAVRVQRQTETAATVADALAEHPKVIAADLSRAVRIIRRPKSSHRQMRGGSTLVAFEVEGGKAGAFRFQDALKLVRISNNLGDAKSLITHPATTTHQRLTPAQRAELGISDGHGAAVVRARASRRPDRGSVGRAGSGVTINLRRISPVRVHGPPHPAHGR